MRKGHIKRGVVKRTQNQEKKHFSQFTTEELVYLENKIKSINTNCLKPSYHLSSKTDIKYKIDDIAAVLKDDEVKNRIIEYNYTKTRYKTDERVLLRSKEEYQVLVNGKTLKCNLCFVISILTNEIITVYYNESKDNHNTIDWTRYNNNLEIIRL